MVEKKKKILVANAIMEQIGDIDTEISWNWDALSVLEAMPKKNNKIPDSVIDGKD